MRQQDRLLVRHEYRQSQLVGAVRSERQHSPLRLRQRPHDHAPQPQQLRFDDHGQLIEKSGPTGHSTRYQYNPSGDPIAITDALVRTTAFEWDKHGQLIGVTRPGGGRTRLVQRTAPKL